MPRLFRAAVALSALLAFSAHGDVRPLSDAERAATSIIASYLAQGPQAVAGQLAASSPLKKLPSAQLLEEIEARLGPPSGSSWELQTIVPALAGRAAAFAVEYPSGVDDSVVFEMKKDGDAYHIENIRILAQKSRNAPLFPPLPETEPGLKTASPLTNALPGLLLAAGILAALLTATAATLRRANASLSRSMIAAGFGVLAVGAGLAIYHDPRFSLQQFAASKKQVVSTDGELELRSLLALRRAIASGTGDADGLWSRANKEGETGRVADLWKAQWDLQQNRLEKVGGALRKFPSPSEYPLAEILKGRLALTKGDEARSVVGYEHAVNLGPGRDGLWLETAQALLALGYEDRAAAYLRRLDKIGSRKPDALYILSLLAAQKNKDDDAEALLKKAWAMRPNERAQLVEAGVLWSVLRRESTVNVIGLSAANEATFTSPDVSARAIALPSGADAWVSGEFLHVQIGGQELGVPGGAVIAPAGTRVADAGQWQRDRDDHAVRDLPQLLAVASDGAFAQPVSRERIVRAANALAKRNRWSDLLKLTDNMAPSSDHVPPELFFLRAQALEHSDRTLDAIHMLQALAASKVLQRHNDAQAVMELGESLAALDEYDIAIKLLDKAQSMHSSTIVDDRVRQIQMNKRLATAYSTVTTQHFQLRVPEEINGPMAESLGKILENELARLQSWIAVPEFKQTVVNIVWWQDFRDIYTGSDFIVGFYNGKITLPFAGVESFEPEVVAILSHELSHAMIAQKTKDQAPHWFQEGLAQRIEMKDHSPNAFNMYTDDRLLAVTLLDPVLRGAPDPGMISEAYVEAQTIIRYIEAKYGKAGVARMMESFRNGATTEEAIQQLTGGSVAQFDTDFRAWGRTSGKVFEDSIPVRYDHDADINLQWTRGRH